MIKRSALAAGEHSCQEEVNCQSWQTAPGQVCILSKEITAIN